jgi:hypothetical protein
VSAVPEHSTNVQLLVRMLPRRHWIAAFVGHVLRRGLADDPDLAYAVGNELYPAWVNCDPEDAADSAFGPGEEQPAAAPLERILH